MELPAATVPSGESIHMDGGLLVLAAARSALVAGLAAPIARSLRKCCMLTFEMITVNVYE